MYKSKKAKGGEMNNIQKGIKTISDWQRDFFVSFLRSQLATLQNVVAEIENSEKLEGGYVEESLKRVEKELHRFRKKLYRLLQK